MCNELLAKFFADSEKYRAGESLNTLEIIENLETLRLKLFAERDVAMSKLENCSSHWFAGSDSSPEINCTFLAGISHRLIEGKLARRSNTKMAVKTKGDAIVPGPGSRCLRRAEGALKCSRRKSRPNRSFMKAGFLTACLLAAANPARGDGIPEPSLVVYGVVNNLAAGGSRVSFGTLTWIFQPADGSPTITVTGVLTNINDQFSYVLRIPCETEIGLPISAGALKLGASYNRSQVTIEGLAANFVAPTQANLVLTRTDRGRIERVDLTVSLSTGGVLPDAWQLQYFGHTGVDPNEDSDHDGMSNLAEYKAGTNPTDAQSLFEFVSVRPDPSGGVLIEWSSVPGKLYTVQRSGDPLGGFADLQIHIPATAPRNAFRDASATGSGPYFYRLRLEE